MPKIFDVVKAMGTYQDSAGNEKTRWMNCGMVIKNADNGKCSLKLNAIPYGLPDDEGWFAMMEPKPRPQQIQPGKFEVSGSEIKPASDPNDPMPF